MKTTPTILLIVAALAVIFSACNSDRTDIADNSLILTQDDEKVILKYLDTKTNDISRPYDGGKIYSSFKLLGTDPSKVYLWVRKAEYIKIGDKVEEHGVISLPVALTIRKDETGISVIKHEWPRDGEKYPKDIKRIFPRGFDFQTSNENVADLKNRSKIRAEEDLLN